MLICLVAVALVAELDPSAAAEVQRELTQIQAETANLTLARRLASEEDLRSRWQRATHAWQEDPRVVAAILAVLVDAYPDHRDRDLLLLELGRARAAASLHEDALLAFLAAAEQSRRQDVRIAALEGFVLSSEHARPKSLPDLTGYLTSLGANEGHAIDIVYRLGRSLARHGDGRAADVLALLPAESAATRRAFYVLGALNLAQGHAAEGRIFFSRAAELELTNLSVEELERDREVRELAWLAVGRLAFEDGDELAGMLAYQQIDVDSPRFTEAFYELGWLALESGREAMALDAFLPVVELAKVSELGRRADLIRGYVLIQQKLYEEAERHYEGVAVRADADVVAFDERVGALGDVLELAQECETRERAKTDPLLGPILERPEIAAAEDIAAQRRSLVGLGASLDAIALEIAAQLDPNQPGSALGRIAKQRQQLDAVLKRTQRALLKVSLAASRATWQASAAATPTPAEPCCNEARRRADLEAHQRQLEGLATDLDRESDRLRERLGELQRTNDAARQEQRALLAEHEAAGEARQRELVGSAIRAARDGIQTIAKEGRAGVLEAVWRHKEDHRALIGALEGERKSALAELDLMAEDALKEIFESDDEHSDESSTDDTD